MIPSYELQVFHREDGSALFIDQTRGREILLPDDAIVFDYGSHWFFPDEISKRPTDERFADYGTIERGKWNPRNWWYHSGKVGSTALILEAAISAWKCAPLQLADQFEELELDETLDRRLTLACAEGNGTVRVSAYLLKRPLA
jgi:hypothetical protein